jgi:Flp pilus assembly protein TadD
MEAHPSLASTLAEQNEFVEADASFGRALQLQPNKV